MIVMSGKRGYLSLIFLILLLFFSSMGEVVEAVEIGGEMEITTGLSYIDELEGTYSGRGELELYLPQARNLESRLVLRGSLRPDDADLGVKYLYLRQRRDNGHITLGRQPVSWSYGAMINPFDFGFGIEGVAEETLTPEIDGVRYFHSLGQGRSLQLVAEFPGEFVDRLDELGYGARLRLPRVGHDMSFNAAYQPVRIIEDNLIRAGLTYSGDIGDAGIYGSAGYYRLEDNSSDDYLAQLGLDYSWEIGPEYDTRPVFLQAEYLRFLQRDLGEVFFLQMTDGMMLTGGEADISNEENGNASGTEPETPGEIGELSIYDLLVASLTVELDPFSRAGAALIGSSGENILALTPFYISELGGGFELRVESNLSYDGDDFGAGAGVGLSYYF